MILFCLAFSFDRSIDWTRLMNQEYNVLDLPEHIKCSSPEIKYKDETVNQTQYINIDPDDQVAELHLLSGMLIITHINACMKI